MFHSNPSSDKEINLIDLMSLTKRQCICYLPQETLKAHQYHKELAKEIGVAVISGGSPYKRYTDFSILCLPQNLLLSRTCRVGAEWPRVEWKYSRVEGSWQQSEGTTLVSACALCLDLLLHVWLHISGEQNCCQEIRRGVVYKLIGVEIDIKDVIDFNLQTKELGCNY